MKPFFFLGTLIEAIKKNDEQILFKDFHPKPSS